MNKWWNTSLYFSSLWIWKDV